MATQSIPYSYPWSTVISLQWDSAMDQNNSNDVVNSLKRVKFDRPI